MKHSRLQHTFKRQRRTSVNNLRLKEMSSEAQARALSGEYHRLCETILGFTPADVTRDSANARRIALGLGLCDQRSAREELNAKVRIIVSKSECLFSTPTSRMFLVYEHGNFYYFIFRNLELKYY